MPPWLRERFLCFDFFDFLRRRTLRKQSIIRRTKEGKLRKVCKVGRMKEKERLRLFIATDCNRVVRESIKELSINIFKWQADRETRAAY